MGNELVSRIVGFFIFVLAIATAIGMLVQIWSLKTFKEDIHDTPKHFYKVCDEYDSQHRRTCYLKQIKPKQIKRE